MWKRFDGDMENVQRQARRYVEHEVRTRHDGRVLLFGLALAVFSALAMMAVIAVSMAM